MAILKTTGVRTGILDSKEILPVVRAIPYSGTVSRILWHRAILYDNLREMGTLRASIEKGRIGALL